MSVATKAAVTLLGGLAAILLVLQLVFGQLLHAGRIGFIKAHQHTGYTTVGLALIYIVVSLSIILAQTSRSKPGA